MTDHGDPANGDLVEPAPDCEVPNDVADAVIQADRLGACARWNGPPVDERVEFIRVAYEDGTLWHLPLIPESQCREAEKRGKSH